MRSELNERTLFPRLIYEIKLRVILKGVVFVQICLLLFRFWLDAGFSLVQTLTMIQVVLLAFITLKHKCKIQAKTYIFITIFILFIVLINLLNSFSVEIEYNNFYKQNLSAENSKWLYPSQLVIRSLCVIVIWRVYEYSHLKQLYHSEFPESETETYY